MKANKPKTKNFLCDDKFHSGLKCKEQCIICKRYSDKFIKNGMQ